ncbi:hypothetical protein BGE01nite_04960 [Brevifollis gellanilyticus]|uniref:Uncharacterized protein n=1 Tax=Brevifollis gellanilyticus TaxID=748831 RepID=A0A512M385_9BACT|nr:hypothetical protein BGE01nite_04960 [Brevifollis gellanilyticus]
MAVRRETPKKVRASFCYPDLGPGNQFEECGMRYIRAHGEQRSISDHDFNAQLMNAST